MKTQLLRMSMFAVVTAAAVYAQNPQVEKVSVPFNFIVGSRMMPAGQYTVEDVRPLPPMEESSASLRTRSNPSTPQQLGSWSSTNMEMNTSSLNFGKPEATADARLRRPAASANSPPTAQSK